ncbi:hypothetical protein Tco_0105108 [Tanacetum coccineum]
MGKEIERGNFPDSLLRMVFHFECLSKKSVDEGFRIPKSGQHETSILTYAVDRNGRLRIRGTSLSSGMSKMTKSTGKKNLPILTSTLTAMPFGCFMVLLANSNVILVETNPPRPSSKVLIRCSLNLVFASIEAQISLMMFKFSSCLFADSAMNLASDSSIVCLRAGYEEFLLLRW